MVLNTSYLNIHIISIFLKDVYDMDMTLHPARIQVFRFLN